MRTHTDTGGVTTPWEKYVFHYLPGIPVLIGLCIIYKEKLAAINTLINSQQKGLGEVLSSFSFFIILLIMVLLTIFLLAMMVDAVRHMFEYAFLTPLWTEYWIADHIYDENTEHLERKFNIITKFHETEYFYTEFFGNAAFSLFFLWGVMYWYDILPLESSVPPKTLKLGGFFVYLHIVFILRAFLALFIWEYHDRASLEKESRQKKVLMNLWHSTLDFSATILSILVLFGCLCYFLFIKGTASVQAFHYYFIMTLVITSSYEVYIVRFRRFEKVLKGGILRGKGK